MYIYPSQSLSLYIYIPPKRRSIIRPEVRAAKMKKAVEQTKKIQDFEERIHQNVEYSDQDGNKEASQVYLVTRLCELKDDCRCDARSRLRLPCNIIL